MFAEQAVMPWPQLPTAQTNALTMTDWWKIHSAADPSTEVAQSSPKL